MASKRGRPLVDESESSAINQNRKKTREHMQRLRSERKQQNKVAIPPTAGQLRQGEQIINLGSIGEENGSHTPAQVGLRVTLVREHLFPRLVVGVAVYIVDFGFSLRRESRRAGTDVIHVVINVL
jgi:hypothetical protein